MKETEGVAAKMDTGEGEPKESEESKMETDAKEKKVEEAETLQGDPNATQKISKMEQDWAIYVSVSPYKCGQFYVSGLVQAQKVIIGILMYSTFWVVDA